MCQQGCCSPLLDDPNKVELKSLERTLRMLRDITGIRLCGANFEQLSDISLLNPREGNKVKPVKGTLLYGRNGSGKSTLAKAVKKAKGDVQDTISQAEFLDINNSPVVLTDEEKTRVFVFDEEYVDKNIKFREAGLSTIIMLGQQAELVEQIQAAHKNLEKVKADCEAQEAIVTENEKVECENSPQYYIRKMRWALQGDDCWAGRDKLIKGNRQNTGVRDDTYKQFIALTTSKTRDQLIIEFNETLKALRAAQQGDAAISTRVPVYDIKYDEGNIIKLLRTRIEKPELSERECYLLELVQTGKTAQLNNMISVFSDEDVSMCPTCMQPVSEEYKQDLIQSIQKILSKAVEEHQEALRAFMMKEIEFDFSPFSKLTVNTDLCLKLLIQINTAIKKNNLIIQSKIDNPYTPCEQEIKSISNLLEQLKVAFENLEIERTEYNKRITATKPIMDRLTKINNLIAHLDIQEPYLRFLACEVQAKKEREKLVEKQEACVNAKRHVDELEAKQKNVKVALSIINSNLSYIFFSNDRFKIDYRDDNYVLLSNGKHVQPSQISQGERNILGLCYFFASILQNQEELTAYKKEYLLLIDDPVSSFDIENKTGIMSFLRYQLGKFLLGNEHTRAIIMTHDLLTYYDAEKVFGELIEASKAKYGGDKPIYKRYELKNKSLIPFPYNGRQEYTELIKIVYNFALGNASEYGLVIGNIMRQMLEAFSTFQYKKGIEDVSTDQNILSLLPEAVYKSYFENLMYRLILNNGSHRLDQTKSMSDMNFFTVISDTEKQRTAKEILCFIYLLNERHLLSHLEGCTDVKTNLSNWCTDIKNRVGA